MIKRVNILLVIFLFSVLSFSAQAETALELKKPIKFSPRDRVLVIAPHPDDETIGAGGVLQQALKAGAKARVCLLTNGENNEFAFIVYERRIVLKPKEFLRLGQVRYQESLDALRVFGLAPEDVVVLGYPDYGTMDIFLKHWGNVKPFRSMLSRARKVPYPDALSPGAPYIGDSILKDLKAVIADFKPTKIFVSHPADVNRDHRAAYLFMQVALWDLEGHIEHPEVYPYLIHIPAWPAPRGYRPELPVRPPQSLERSDVSWIDQPLDIAEIAKKHDAVLKYPSQIKYAPRYLVTFARRNEMFGTLSPVVLERQMASDPELVWTSVGVNEPPKGRIKSDSTENFAELAYARQGNYLLVRVAFRRAMEKDFGLSIFLVGYSAKVPFADMPKINLLAGADGVRIREKRASIPSKEVLSLKKEKEILFKVPLALLGGPDRILSCARTVLYGLAFDETAWRVLEIK